jgi:hypothetical protein
MLAATLIAAIDPARDDGSVRRPMESALARLRHGRNVRSWDAAGA